MKRKILIPVIIVVLVAFVAIGIFGCQRKPISVSITPAKTPEEIEIEKRLPEEDLLLSGMNNSYNKKRSKYNENRGKFYICLFYFSQLEIFSLDKFPEIV